MKIFYVYISYNLYDTDRDKFISDGRCSKKDKWRVI